MLFCNVGNMLNKFFNLNSLLAFSFGLALGLVGAYSLQQQYDERVATLKDFYQKQEADLRQKMSTAEEHKAKPKTVKPVDTAKKTETPASKPILAQNKTAKPAAELSPRHLSEEQKTDLTRELKWVAKRINRTVVYASAVATPESQSYLAEIISAFQASEINIQFGGTSTFEGPTPETNRGLFLAVKNKEDPSYEAKLVYDALTAAGLKVTFVESTTDRAIDLIIGYNPNNTTA